MIETDSKRAMKRWGVSARTLDNWAAKGRAVGEAPPVLAEDPRELVEWYRRHYGREPGKKVREAAERMRLGAGPRQAVEVAVDTAPQELIGAALERVGMAKTLERLVAEEEVCWAEMLEHRKSGDQGAAADARRRWKEIAEVKRQAQKGDDAVAVALELLKAWIRTEWADRQAQVRDRLVAVVGAEELDRVLRDEGGIEENA